MINASKNLSQEELETLSQYEDKTVEEIEVMQIEQQTRADLIFQIDPQVVAEYNNRKKEIQNAANIMDKQKYDLEDIQKKIESVRVFACIN